MVGVTEVDFGVNACSPGSIEKISHERDRITVLLRDTIETPEIHAKPETTVLLPGEQDRSSARGTRGADETCTEILVKEFPEGFEF
jgi:hypothetical protein